MKKPAKDRTATLFFLAISTIGLGIVAILTYSQTIPNTDFAWQKPATGVMFSVICVLGIIAGLSPRRCSSATHFKAAKKSSAETQKPLDAEKASTTFKGHHPDCGNFSAHTLSFNGRTLCAGCTGLVLGAVLSLVGCFAYFFVGLPIEGFSGVVFWLGFFGVLCGLLQYELPVNDGFVHFLLNVVFVLGAFLLVVEVNAARESLVLNLYLLLLTVYWVLTRIELSRIEHRRKCLSCGSKPCSVSFVK